MRVWKEQPAFKRRWHTTLFSKIGDFVALAGPTGWRSRTGRSFGGRFSHGETVRRDHLTIFRAQFTVDLGVFEGYIVYLYIYCIRLHHTVIRLHTCLYETIRSEQVLETPIAGPLKGFLKGLLQIRLTVLQSSKLHHSLINRAFKSPCNHKFHRSATLKNSPVLEKSNEKQETSSSDRLKSCLKAAN